VGALIIETPLQFYKFQIAWGAISGSFFGKSKSYRPNHSNAGTAVLQDSFTKKSGSFFGVIAQITRTL